MSENGEPAGPITRGLAAGVPDRGIGLTVGDVRTIGGMDLLPVALVSYGFGALDESRRFGAGGGAGGVAIPFGAYCVVDGSLRFRPNTIVLGSLLIPIIGTLGLAVSMVVRAIKHSR